MKKYLFIFFTSILGLAPFSLGQMSQFTVTKSNTTTQPNDYLPGACDIAHLAVNEEIRSESSYQGIAYCWGAGFIQIGPTLKNIVITQVSSHQLTCRVNGTAVFECLKKATLPPTGAKFTLIESSQSSAYAKPDDKLVGLCDLAHMVVDNNLAKRALQEGPFPCNYEPFQQIGKTSKEIVIQRNNSNIATCIVNGKAEFQCFKKPDNIQSMTVYCKGDPCQFNCHGTISNVVIKNDTYDRSSYGSATCTKE